MERVFGSLWLASTLHLWVHREQHVSKSDAWRDEKPRICTTCTKHGITHIYKRAFSSKIRRRWDCITWKQSYQIYQVYIEPTVQNRIHMIYVSLGSVKISRLIYCQRHPAISSILLLLKSVFQNTKMPAEMQTRKHCKTIKTRSIVPSNIRKRTQVTGYSLTNDTHKLSSGEIITYIQTFNRTCQKLASRYKTRTKEKIPSAAPSLQLFQPAEGSVYLKKKK